MQKIFDGLGGKDKVLANINPSTVIVVAGIAKVFVGELIEEGPSYTLIAAVLPSSLCCTGRLVRKFWR